MLGGLVSMALDFPATPTVGEIYTGPSGQIWIWDGQKWVFGGTPAGGGASVELGDTPPASPSPGNLWFDTVGSQLYIFDTDQNQWIITTNTPGGGGGGGAVDLTGSSLQLAFFFPGVPTSATTVIIPIAVAITIPANLAGSVTYLGDTPAANTGNFILYHSSGSGSQGIGTISFNTNGVPTFGGTGGTIPAGDALLMDSPSTPDTQLSNIGITILATRA